MTTSPVEARDTRDETFVCAIVVNYRTPALTIQCVESLLRSAATRPRILVVDNASGDESVRLFRSAFASAPAVTVEAVSTNGGYTGGNNAGLVLARRMGARYACVLNSDTVVDRDCLKLLVEEAERDSQIALVSPRIFFGEPRDRLWFGGGRFSLWTGRPRHVGWRRRASQGWQESRDLPFATGCALLIRLEALGDRSFDASLFSYAEDLDLSLRVRSAGYRIRYVPDAVVWHFEGASHRRAGGQSLRFYLGTRNLLRIVARYARWYHWITLAPMLAVDVVGRFCAVAVRDRDVAAFFAVLRGAWHAVAGGHHPIEGVG